MLPGPTPLLSVCGWGTGRGYLIVMDLQTGEGAIFRPGGYAHADLEKHQVWVCPMFEPFLEWLYKQNRHALDALPRMVELPDAEFYMPATGDSVNDGVGRSCTEGMA
jgi:hypothetical protein